jgi:hypothetical protein
MRIDKPRACVRVRVERTRTACTLRVDGGVSVLKPDARVAPLPEGIVVLNEDGTVCEAVGRFYVTLESFDPYHLITDVF